MRDDVRLGPVPPDQGGIKLQLLLDHDGCWPSFAVVSEGWMSYVRMAGAVELPADSILVVYRGYVDYLLFGQWCERGGSSRG